MTHYCVLNLSEKQNIVLHKSQQNPFFLVLFGHGFVQMNLVPLNTLKMLFVSFLCDMLLKLIL